MTQHNLEKEWLELVKLAKESNVDQEKFKKFLEEKNREINSGKKR